MEGDEKKGSGKGHVNAQFSEMPATECIGAGRLDGWFVTPAYIAENRGWGHIRSLCFEGDLFFHLQRSPWLRGINFQKKDEVTFEVIEVNGKVEAVKLLLPSQVAEMEEKATGTADESIVVELVGQRVQGFMKSHYLLVEKQHWGFVGSDAFPGQVFWHMQESPDMQGVDFDRGDIVEFDIDFDDNRNSGGTVRAKNMRFLSRAEKPIVSAPELTDSKRRKKEQWLKNWSTTPPPDWVCKHCGWQNFGRNKTCNFNNKNGQNCPGVRPPREEWPDTQNVKASDVDTHDVIAQKALQQRLQAHKLYGKEDEVPQGFHSTSSKAETNEGSWSGAPIPVPVLGQEDMPLMIEAGMPGAVAAAQLQERIALEKAGWQVPSAPAAQQYSPYGKGGGYGSVYDPAGVFAAGYAAAVAAGYQFPGYGYAIAPAAGYSSGYATQDGGYGKVVDIGKGDGKGKGAKGKSKNEAQATASLPNEDVEATMAASLQAFNELSQLPENRQDAQVAHLVAEVNHILGADRSAKHAFAMQLARHPFFSENKFEVRYQPGKNMIVVARPGAQYTPQVVLPPDAPQQRLLRA